MPTARGSHLVGTWKTGASASTPTTPVALPADGVDSSGEPREGTGRVLGAWFAAFAVANLMSALVVGLAGYGSGDSNELPTWVVALSVVAMWVGFMALMPRLMATPAFDARSVRAWFRASDAVVGIPLGIASQLILVNAVNWPLARLFPDTFSFDEVSKRAKELSEAAHGGWMVVLFLVVVIGAPLVEEYVYRGSLQPAFTRNLGASVGVIGTAVLFAAIHFQPIEFPGLFAFALVLGVARHRSGTLGLSIVTHMAFNATGLVLVILT